MVEHLLPSADGKQLVNIVLGVVQAVQMASQEARERPLIAIWMSNNKLSCTCSREVCRSESIRIPVQIEDNPHTSQFL